VRGRLVELGVVSWLASVDAAGQAVRVGDMPGAYEQMYGKPEHWPLRDLALGTRPQQNRAIWTQGQLSVTGETFRLCVPNEALCIALDRPAPEIRETFLAAARSRSGELATVTGAWIGPGSIAQASGVSGLMFWGFESGPMPKPTSRASDRPSLEDVVRDPGRFAGRSVLLDGCFQGERWADAEHSPRPAADAWVMSDGPFHVWVWGRPPAGKGWQLGDADAGRGFRVEVTGKVVRASDGAYVQADRVRLLWRDQARCP
jgi:hypothetical protein